MPIRKPRNRLSMTQAEIMAAYPDDRDDERLDAALTVAALVARADGWIAPVERGDLLDFLDRNGFLSDATRPEILDAFERRVRQLDERRGAAMADSLGRLAGRPMARLAIAAGERVAAADGHLHPHELHALRFIRITLSGRSGAGRGGGPVA